MVESQQDLTMLVLANGYAAGLGRQVGNGRKGELGNIFRIEVACRVPGGC